MRIALDAMGGDFGPAPNMEGARAALEADPDLQIALVGDVPQLEALLASTGGPTSRIELIAAEGFVGMEEKPTEALRKKPNASIAVCWKLMASKEVDAVVSAGHTGAVVAAGLRTRLYLPGVKRPGIAVALPTLKGRAVLMDVGANPGAKPEHLYQYGIMGSIYAREMLGVEKPRVGLMNIGSEDGKGIDLVREAHVFLADCRHMRESYIGNVEGRDLYAGAADVIICEGFVGNVVLKVSEGIAEMFMKSVAGEVLGRLQQEREVAHGALQNLAKKYAYHESGGAPLLGIDGICMICHGASDGRAIMNALKHASRFGTRKINEQIIAQLAEQPA